jgi:hypothetical protein
MEYAIGAFVAIGVALFGTLAGFDRSRAFYPTVSIVVASYYGLFAVMAGAVPALGLEMAVFVIFALLAVAGFRVSLWFAAAALIGHGLLDIVHGDLISNPGVPAWWPGFCMAYDVVAGLYLALLLTYRDERSKSFAAAIRPFVDQELRGAGEADAAGDAARSFHHLERAHVLSQSSTALHVSVHLRMLMWGVRHKRPREIAGQIFRLAGAAVLTRFRAVPHGNTGGTNVSAFQPMPIPEELADIISQAERPFRLSAPR